jgi:hypothetical protein
MPGTLSFVAFPNHSVSQNARKPILRASVWYSALAASNPPAFPTAGVKRSKFTGPSNPQSIGTGAHVNYHYRYSHPTCVSHATTRQRTPFPNAGPADLRLVKGMILEKWLTNGKACQIVCMMLRSTASLEMVLGAYASGRWI